MPKKTYRNYSELFTFKQVLKYYISPTDIELLSYEFPKLANSLNKQLEHLIETKQLSAIINLLEIKLALSLATVGGAGLLVRPTSVPKILRRPQRQNAISRTWEVAA